MTAEKKFAGLDTSKAERSASDKPLYYVAGLFAVLRMFLDYEMV